ncbi:MAG TPA: hypothetical protein VNO32_13460 [Candidatus Acidoferrum sp.]|nr:hypothetical protein [Candidatus Acidoferrum sp.]
MSQASTSSEVCWSTADNRAGMKASPSPGRFTRAEAGSQETILQLAPGYQAMQATARQND